MSDFSAFDNALRSLESIPLARVAGRLVRLNGILLESVGCPLMTGQLCRIESANHTLIDAQAVGFNRDITYLMPFKQPVGLMAGARVFPEEKAHDILIGESAKSGGRHRRAVLAAAQISGVAMKTVITFGTFDVFHVGHLRLLQRARALGERLLVGVSSDALNIAKKGRAPVYHQDDRMAIIAGLACVDGVFLEESLEQKAEYLRGYSADILVMGDDWAGKFDSFAYICEVVYFPRTPSVSTTGIIEVIRGLL